MDYNKFEEIIRRKYPTKKTDRGLTVEIGLKSYEVLYDETADYKNLYSLIDRGGLNDLKIGESDLYPSGTIKDDRISGAILDPNHPFFTKKIPEGARFDPIRPTKDKTKGWDPNPDHFKKPEDDDDQLFE
ncbi:hypothetical protein H312_01054 [Anncaliia algerae PRA339]|uniref:Uncharacterized protein n=1 Tax=Anncaliia algerae PRA339 TaxID=1288291 RepID=A0A059F3D7_9MICR|nr:hypothetical protein H312_01054 [Anncaliia algerae PRA339]